MRLLLDTHIWLWAELEEAKLGRHTARLLADGRHELWLSPVSVWELIQLSERKRVQLDREVGDWVEAFGATPRYRTADLTRAVALAARQIRLEHGDPADRLLAATARHYELTLVSADEQLLGGAGFERFADR